MKVRSLSASLLLLALAASCANVPLGGEGLPTRTSVPANRPGDTTWNAASGSTETVLYARDGSPVRRSSGDSALTSGQESVAQRNVSESGGSRPYLLELYQQAVSDKDQLSLEVTALNQELSRQDEAYRELESEFEQFKQQFTQLETERDEIQKQNFELAGRLTTAQIRRLESEKMLLEAIIEQRRRAREDALANSDNVAPGFLKPEADKSSEPKKAGGQR